MYKPFSKPENIEKMVRQLDIFVEEETLEATLLNWKDNPFRRNWGHWVKYVSTRSGNPREMFLYWDRQTEDDFLEEITRDLLEDRGYFGRLERYFKDSYRDFGKFTDGLFKEKEGDFFQRKTNSALAAIFKEFNIYHKRSLAGYYVVYDLANLFPRLVKKDIAEKFPGWDEERIDGEVRFFSSAGITSVVIFERLEFLKNLQKVQSVFSKSKNWEDKSVRRIIESHWHKFCGCSFKHAGGFYSFEDYLDKFKKNIRSDVVKEIAKLKKEQKKERAEVEKRLARYGRYPEIKKHIGWLRRFMGYRNHDEEYYHSHFIHASRLFDEISHRLGLGENDIWLLSKKEITGSLKGGLGARKIVAERKKKGYTIKQIGSRIEVFTGVRKEDWHERKVGAVESLEGMTAQSGKAQGKARVIFNPSCETLGFEPGDILVTSMTTPDFVPLIKKAAAVVTDEGGLLCHAAIVSRELKTPCIIGTKIATKVLKDGDRVEVDADEGVVRIIKA